MRDNIEAIRLALNLGVAGRTAQTPEEREVLRKYAGFGGLKCILNDANELSDAAKWSKSDIELFMPTVELRRLIHDYSKDDKEFAQYMDSLKTSVLTAFYTPLPVVNALSDALKYSGVEVKSFLEPSAGQGAFIDSFLRNDRYPGAEVLAYEKDLLTGKILSALHPSILTNIEGFEKIGSDFPGYFDVAASNIPFGDFAVADPAYAVSKDIAYRQAAKTIHNYFFLKSLDKVREGGLVKRADLVAALRLPNNTFSDNAGTDAGADLIILQKYSGEKALLADEEFFIQSVVERGTKVPGNKFFQAFPQNVICTDAKVSTDQYGKPAIVYTHRGGVDGIAEDLRKALIMCIAAHEMKRLGLAHKPMIIGLKANVAEIAMTYQTAYPNARILFADEKSFKADNRINFFNQIRNNDYDCVIMSHDQFGKIPQSPEMQ